MRNGKWKRHGDDMAENDGKASLIITLKDEVSKGLEGLKGKLATFKNAWIGATAAVAGLTAVLVASFREYIESERAITRLNKALQNQGIYSKELSRDLQAYAKELQ